ncbi:MAG TPA: DUF4407 domain-containing protein [Saprospiraceae bacterium]|nr:DUF4407 domain-containing protein [Saprospiraceae bacterium]HNT21880.1 DUF4407 domain-containing protein [Saprospiraceae bacterium]
MTPLERFFLMCSGSNPAILKKSPTDINKYIGIGATIFFTGVLAFIASAYAIYTVFDSWIASLAFGLTWGLMIFNLDRYIVSSMKRQGSGWQDFFTALPRLLLAVIISIVISKPLELKIFEKEINAELIIMEQEVYKTQEQKVRERFDSGITGLQQEVGTLKTEVETLRAKRDELAEAARQEADGTGGSRQRNLGPIYKTKKQDADRAEAELNEAIARNQPLIAEKENAIKSLQEASSSEVTGLQRAGLGGFASRIDALSRLSEKSGAIWIASLFIMLLFIAIETAPIFVKLISSRSPYDYVLHKHEHVFEMNHQQLTSILATATRNKIAEENEINTFRTQATVKAEKQLIEHAIREEVERLKQQPAGWKAWWSKGRFLGAEG